MSNGLPSDVSTDLPGDAGLPGLPLGAPVRPVSSSVIENLDFCADVGNIERESIDLIVADPPYGLGKDYGNDSDKLDADEHLEWTEHWLQASIPLLKPSGSLYIFCSWQFAPEIFSFLKRRMMMVNEIVWDRRVPSMGGTTRRFTSVHDNIGLFVRSRHYYFDLDPVRVPYDAATKKARSRKLFEGSKWLEMGYNPKDVWSVSRLHRQHTERVDHPTQKPLEIIERMVLASCPPGGTVLDPFMGSGTTAVACARQGRHFLGYEINADYCEIARQRVAALRDSVPYAPMRSSAVAGVSEVGTGAGEAKGEAKGDEAHATADIDLPVSAGAMTSGASSALSSATSLTKATAAAASHATAFPIASASATSSDAGDPSSEIQTNVSY